MKKYMLFTFCLMLWTQSAAAEFKKEVIIFSQPCYFCEKMKEALNNGIITANPDITFTILDIQDKKNDKFLHKHIAKHNLKGEIGLPLLFIGKNYISGWGPNATEELQQYIEIFKKENISRMPSSLSLKNK